MSHQYQLRKQLLNQFWKIWTNAYLLDLQTTKKWHDLKKIDIKIGEVLLIREENLSRGEWKMG